MSGRYFLRNRTQDSNSHKPYTVGFQSVCIKAREESTGFPIFRSAERVIEVPVLTTSAVSTRSGSFLFRRFSFRDDPVVLGVLIAGEIGMGPYWFLLEELLFNEISLGFGFVCMDKP